MVSLAALLVIPQVLLMTCGASKYVAADEQRDPFATGILQDVAAFDVAGLSDSQAVRLLLQFSECCRQLELAEQGNQFLRAAEQVAASASNTNQYRSLFRFAVHLKDIELATKYSKGAGEPSSILDQLAAARYRLGDRSVLEGFPNKKMTLHNALDMADAMIQVGDWEAAEKFVTDIKISQENDPRAVTGITYRNLAKKCVEKGDLESGQTLH